MSTSGSTFVFKGSNTGSSIFKSSRRHSDTYSQVPFSTRKAPMNIHFSRRHSHNHPKPVSKPSSKESKNKQLPFQPVHTHTSGKQRIQIRGRRIFRVAQPPAQQSHNSHASRRVPVPPRQPRPPSHGKGTGRPVRRRTSAGRSARGSSGHGRPSSQSAQEPTKNESGQSVYSPHWILSQHRRELTAFEQSEILQYAKVYYWGQNTTKTYSPAAPNHGYDDQRGDYLGLVKDHVCYRFEILSQLGAGSFGRVFKVFDHAQGRLCALKVIRNRRRFHRQGLVEVRVLEHLRKHDPHDTCNVLRVNNSFYFRSHLCITTELLSLNLYELLVRGDFKGMSLSLVRKFALQLLNALRYGARHNIVHCDLKPENVLLRDPLKSGIKVIDYGSACFEDERIYSYIQSRFYRAPEVILGIPYGLKIDMFSLGCLLAELFTGHPIFPGEDERDQLGRMSETLGLPPREMISAAPRRAEFFRAGRLRSRHRPASRALDSILDAPPQFIDFMEGLLRWDPAQRLSPDDALAHPWMVEGINLLRAKRVTSKDPAQSPAQAAQSPHSPSAVAVVSPPRDQAHGNQE